jgi:hypothetical protein
MQDTETKVPSDDTPSGFNGLTYGEIREWERKSADSCKRHHEQPCNCDPWD